ncbi:jg13144 [Pararge aegeria aegeria]|uniref:Jg13144 protein n=1 Tax=Pararge aegeria aegeria TaxID=348720 RepID=A0A8S4RV46_9NEOP|nr:jg13144 [Pararge aegeria aegeria]
MSGDFERQYANDIAEKGSKKRRGCVIFGVTVGVLAVWLIVLTIVREVQVNRLRQEVDELSANMIAMSATVKSLNERLTNNRLFNEFKTLEDTIYADDDQDGNLINDAIAPHKENQGTESLDKLHDLTVLEDDNELADDEDMYDGDESGDWYPDYDNRREKIGTTNMVRLKPDDFTDTMAMSPQINLKEIKRLLNENPEIQDIHLPTHPPSTVPSQSSRDKRSVFPDSTLESVSDFSEPKVASKMEERRKTKKFTPSVDAISKIALHTVSRTARNRNGLLRVAHGAPHDVWYPSPWTAASPLHSRPTLTRSGHVNVHHSGVYLVYVQIYYLDSHDVISWVLHRTNPYMEGRDTLLQCAQSSHSSERLDKPNSCFSAAALFLRAGDKLAVRNTGGDRHSLMQPEKSFIGLIKLADAEEPNDEM